MRKKYRLYCYHSIFWGLSRVISRNLIEGLGAGAACITSVVGFKFRAEIFSWIPAGMERTEPASIFVCWHADATGVSTVLRFMGVSRRILAVFEERLIRGIDESLYQISMLSFERIDLEHVDIQGSEIPMIPGAFKFIKEKTSMILVGLHSRGVGGGPLKVLTSMDWSLGR